MKRFNVFKNIDIKKLKQISRFRFAFLIVFFLVLLSNLSAYFLTYGEFTSRFGEAGNNNTNISTDVVTIDDLRSDYDYYMGLNYTNSDDGKLPSGTNQSIYSDENLVQIKITYSGKDNDNDLTGYVSKDERQFIYKYYKMFPINDNGTSSKDDDYVTFDLIDNPFTDRPDSKVFNGWTTKYRGASISFDSNYYVRKVKIPVTYDGNEVNPLEIEFNANWIKGSVGVKSSSATWASVFSNLDSVSMKKVVVSERVIEYEPYDMTGYYSMVTISRWESYAGYYNNRGQYQNRGTCYSRNGCTYYSEINNEDYDSSKTYYELSGGYMTEVDPSSLNLVIKTDEVVRNEDLYNANVSGFYRQVTIERYASIVGYYDSNGTLQTSGTCNTSGGCEYYELIQYYDSDNNEELASDTEDYYYLVTRDTNIIVMTENVSDTWSSSQDKPFTLTSKYGDYDNDSVWSLSSGSGWGSSSTTVYAYADMAIENLIINSGSSFSSSTDAGDSSRSFYGNYHNVKFGRGIEKSGSNSTFVSIIGGSGSSSGSRNNVTKYSLIIESGFYSSIAITNGISNRSTPTIYTESVAVYGNDYDRASSNNSKLDIYYCASGSWGGYLYASDNNGIFSDLTVKSGSFGTGKTDHTAGIYVGGRYGGTHYAARKVSVQGGYIYNLIGGPLTASTRGSVNDTYMYIRGGVIDMLTGGAGTSATYGNRIIQLTGGEISYSVFGGSNGWDGSDGDGTLNGSSLIYAGGTVVIGNEEYITNNNTLFNAEAGSIFGIGNGKSTIESIGSSDNSNIIIDTGATIKKNVYGGGNFSAVGISSSESTTSTNITMYGGEVKGSIFGGGNNNGSGSSSIKSTININVNGGKVLGSVYGGANEKGTIYGNVFLNINSGEVSSVYGGGKGGYESSDSPGTYVSENIRVVIGNSSYDAPVISGEVFGGSAFGTVNGTTRDDDVSSYDTIVTVNKGTISSVYGGGKGDSTFVPYVKGNVTTIINDGKIVNVFGGNDASGTPNGTVKVYLKGGEVTSAYGGGNKTSVNTTNVYLQGSTCENVFGGSNYSGDVSVSNVIATSGTSVNLYGGNNQGGTTNTSNVLLDGATIESIYGGGNVAVTTKTSINLKSGNAISVYGGGKSASITSDTLVNLNGATCNNIFGGSDSSGDVPESIVNINSGISTNVYGGNNQGGVTTTTNINLEGGKITNVFGGGNEASSVTSNIKLDGSSVSSIYGGGNEAGLTTSNIDLLSGSSTNVYGGSNNSGDVDKSNITTSPTEKDNININTELKMDVDATAVAVDSSWQDTNYNSVVTLNVTITNNSSETITEYNGKIKAENSSLYSNYSGNDLTIKNDTYSFDQINKYDSNRPYSLSPGASHTFSFQIYSKKTASEFIIDDFSITGITESGDSLVQSNNKLVISSVYGGNNQGGTTNVTDINLDTGYIHNVFGGGNNAPVNDTNLVCNGMTVGGQLYGGGNNAGVNNSTKVEIISSNISGSIFGGGNNGFVGKNTDVYVSSSTVGESIYAGGNGASATTNGNANVTIDGTSNISKHVFGGGNAATTGTESENNSVSKVNIVGATIGGNVYGGANTSKVFGNTKVNIGKDTVNDDTLVTADILIKGTIFGGGEANASGSENYDFSFISVTKGIDIFIDGNNHENFSINGSIFGSGNASSTSGYSNITISNYGTSSDIKKNISLQRADIVTINNSYLEFSGTTDRTNEYADELFAISRVDKLKIKNNTSLYLKNGANLLKHLVSAVDIGDNEVKATVLIDDETKKVVKNVDNRIYMYEGKVLNVATNQNITAYGIVDGMSFFGMYQKNRDGKIETAMYDKDYNYGDAASSGDLYYFTKGSYVLGLHKDNHDITVDGFYSNFDNENDTGKIKTAYIEPTPENASYYMWSIGEQVSSYEISLTASKYLTLGTEELSLIRHSTANSVFSIVGFNYNDLASGVNLVKEDDVPRIAASGTDADNTMSLVMKTPSSGWMNNGETTFLSNEDNQVYGTTTYKRENSALNPTLQFYLYHSKNLETSGDMGEVTISLLVITPKTDLESDIERVNIVVKLNRALYNTNDYEASITSGKQYGLFATDDVNITSTGSFSTYYSLYAEKEDFYKTGYHRTLVSDYVLPKNTKLTMIDYSDHDNPEYYYHVITEEEQTQTTSQFNSTGEASYDFNKFIKMGSTSADNKYDDSLKNTIYYDSDKNAAHEEFIFIVDFGESNITSSVIDKTLLIELRDSNNQTRVSVLGIEQSLMKYNLHTNKNSVIDISGSLDNTNVHPGDTVKLEVVTDFIQQTYNGNTVYDTSYFDKQLGIKISLYDKDKNLVTGASLLGFTYELDGKVYYPRMDGTVRINIAEKVSNVLAKIKIKTTDSLAAGTYTMKIESFGSPDGIYYGLESSDYTTLTFNVLDTVYGLSVSLPEKETIIDKKTGKNLNKNNVLAFNYKYNSVLNNPKIYISLKRRDYSSVYSTSYEPVDLKDYISNNYSDPVRDYEYLLSSNPVNNTDIFIYMKDNLKTGTYKVVFSLYDGDSYIGEVYNYIIIK